MSLTIAATPIMRLTLLLALCTVLGIGETHAQGSEAPRQLSADPEAFKKMIEDAKRRAEAGDAEAQYVYSTLFGADGAKEAAKWCLRAAEQGHAKAQARAGVIYDTGAGVNKDAAEAVKWLTRAAGNGQKFAQYYLGRKYAVGLGVTKDAGQATKWLRASADQGHALAQYELARIANTSGDRKEALRWFRASAERGFADAQYELADLLNRAHPDELRAMLYPGSKTPAPPPELQQERAEAKKWYQAAAEGGVPQAQYYMARHAPDQTEALKWYYLVALHLQRNPFDRPDFEGTASQISKLEQSLGPTAREEAQRRTKQWLSQQPTRNLTLSRLVDGV